MIEDGEDKNIKQSDSSQTQWTDRDSALLAVGGVSKGAFSVSLLFRRSPSARSCVAGTAEQPDLRTGHSS